MAGENIYKSKYFTAEEIDQRLLQGYYDDAVSKGFTGTFEDFKNLLARIPLPQSKETVSTSDNQYAFHGSGDHNILSGLYLKVEKDTIELIVKKWGNGNESKHSIPSATTESAGVMSAADKKKLNNLAVEGANVDLNTYHLDGVYVFNHKKLTNVPILNDSVVSARLTVLTAYDGTSPVITQVLNLNNLGGGEGNIYIRSYQDGTWKPWAKLQTNVEVGLIDQAKMDDLTDNGIYSGILSTTGETFVIICINNYAIAQQVGVQHISHLKYSLVVGTGEVKIEKRTRDDYGIWTEWENIGSGSAVAELMQEVTYSELVALRDNASLVAGMKYRITDYVTTTVQENTKSENHPFDVIVEAISENELSELAQAIQHEGDTYFSENDLGAWQLWYSLDNDTNKYAWADAENGKGVIYRMIDEKNNDCPYDFKNILFYTTNYTINSTSDNYYYTFSYVISGVLYDGTIEKRVTGCRNNSMGVCIASGKSILNGNIFINSSFEYNCANNTFGYSCYNNTFGDNCYNNTFGYSCYNNTFGYSCYNNTFGYGCYNNTFGYGCYNNTFRYNCQSNKFEYNCTKNTFGDSCYNNTFGYGCYNNTFGDNCANNTFGYSCYNNTFGDNCANNTFRYNCQSNKFGNGCYNNTFGDNCQYNTFGNGATDRVFYINNTSITFNEKYYDDGTNALVPIKHPDLSTQPNILPYKFMGQYVYEQLISVFDDNGEFTYNIPTRRLTVDNPIILECFCVGMGYVAPCKVSTTMFGEENYIQINVQSDNAPGGKELYYKIVYTSMPKEGGYYKNSATLKGVLVMTDSVDITPGSMYNGDTYMVPVGQGREYYYDIPNDYSSSNASFTISGVFETITVQYSIPDIGESGTLEHGSINNTTSYVPLPGELVDKAKQYLVIITIENI